MSAPGPGWPLVLALLCLPQLLRLVLSIPVLTPLDFNEGWNALHVQALDLGLALYPARGEGFGNNYPPLSFLAVQAASGAIPDFIVAGRAVATLSFLALCLFTGLTARIWAGASGGLWAGTYLAALFLAYSHYPGINDPQMLGHALAAAGLWVVARHPGAPRALAAAAVLMVLAGCVKQNLVVLPLSLLIWLLRYERRSALAFCLASVSAAGLAWWLCETAYGPGFLAHLLTPRVHAWSMSLDSGGHWLVKTGPLLLLLGGASWYWKEDVQLRFCAIYAGIGSLSGVYFIGGAGVDQNVFFDVYIACTLGFALALRNASASSPLCPHKGRAALATAFLTPIALSAAIQAAPEWLEKAHWLTPHQDEVRRSAVLIQALRTAGRPALCGEPAFCYWGGQGRVVDPFGHSQGVATGHASPDALYARVRQREFAAIQNAPVWGEAMLRVALESGYRAAPGFTGEALLLR
ncbi:MAG: hypothetical protein HZB71_08015 [Betaproteobacteria bacterium]|nr:hypothetical protein [Betaproteobacteria bacterium]